MRASGVALSVVFAVGQIATYQHLAEVQHTRCAEHGELIDVHPVAGPVVTTTPIGRGLHFSAAPGSDADHRHEHCALAPHRRDERALGLERDTSGIVPRPSSRAALVDETPTTPSFEAIYRLAPKTSPPA